VEGVKQMQTIALLTVLFALAASSSATSCIWGKKFKTRKICGIVRDMGGAKVPDATIQIERPETQEAIAESRSQADGSFALTGVSSGDYVIRVKFNGFWDASQSFQLDRPVKGERCSHPIRVVMKPAGSCSYVENAWKK
jgi:hypothetical protein